MIRLLGAANAAREGVRRLWEDAGRPGRLDVLVVGQGGGEVSRALLRWADRAGVRIAITLLVRSHAACEHAAGRSAGEPRVLAAQGDMQRLRPASVDIVGATLVLHRLPAIQIPWTLLHWRQAARIGVVAVEPDLPVRRRFSADDVAELRSYPGLEGLRCRSCLFFCCQITLGGDRPPCGM